MPDRFNPLRIQPPPEARTNMLAGPPQPDWAGATDENIRLYNDFLARDRQRQIELGNIDPVTGQFTPQGWQAQAQTVAGGFGPADIGATGLLGTIKAYHGSPHAFERFSSSKIGTGEGAQAYGHGLYFAENEGVARGYRDNLSNRQLQYGDKPLDAHAADSGNPYAQEAAHTLKVAVNLGQAPADALAATVADARRIADQAAAMRMPRMAEYNIGKADWLETIDPSKLQAKKGHMYEVNLAAEPDQFLHWDKPISAQNPAVQEMARRVGIDPRDFDIVKGAALYRKAGDHFGPGSNEPSFDMAATTGLRDAGIPGIRYLDAGSRGGNPDAPGATHNNVVFDANTIDIIRRYGIAGLVGGGAAATAAGGQDQGNQ